MQEGIILRNTYRLERLLGRGGMADVYLAFDISRQAYVAVKILRDDLAEDPDFVRRFAREAEALAKLHHPNIVRFYSFDRQGVTAFIVMDYVPGTTLQRRLAEAGGPLPLADITKILRQAGAALQFAHGEGYVHRDIKPGNIMLREDGTALLSDFGIARAAESATQTTATLGTPAYMSPEQILGRELDRRTDIYSLGVVLFEMATGRRPFTGDERGVTGTSTLARLREAHLRLTPPAPQSVNPALPASVGAVITRALAKDSNERWPDVLSLMQAWEAAISPGEATVVMPGAGMPVEMPRQPTAPAADPSYPRHLPAPSTGTVPPGVPASVAPWPTAPTHRQVRQPQPAAGSRYLLPVLVGAVVVGVALLAFIAWKLLTGGGAASAKATEQPTLTAEPPVTVVVVVAAPSSTLAPTPTEVHLPPTDAVSAATQPPAPAAMPTARPADTATPEPAPSPTPARPQVVVKNDNINIRSGPGTGYNVVEQARKGTVFNIVARTPAGDWYRLEGDRERWVSATLVDVSGEVPVAAKLPPTPVVTHVSSMPILLLPVDGFTLWPYDSADFQWKYTGPPLTANQGFELRIWKEGNADHPGAAPPVPYVADPNHVYSIYIGSIRAAPGIKDISETAWINVYWTVAVVQLDPYRRIGPEPKPFWIHT